MVAEPSASPLASRPAGFISWRLALFAIAAGVVLNVVLTWLPRALSVRDAALISSRTTLRETRRFLSRDAGGDSWDPMRAALRQVHSGDSLTLYERVFFRDKTKFQYPPTSLLPLELLHRLPGRDFTTDGALNGTSWLSVWGVVVLVTLLFLKGMNPLAAQTATSAVRINLIVWVGTAGLATLTFYPLVKSFTLGQIQTWITFLVTAMVLAWVTRKPRVAGGLAGVICLIKPPLAPLVLWAAVRRHWGFAGAMLAVALGGLLASLALYGWHNHVDYLRVLSFISRHGETYYPNQSVNGLLNRLLFNGSNLTVTPREFAPFHPVVYVGTMVSSLALVAAALFWRRRDAERNPTFDFAIMILTLTVASPVAWEHHYGVLLPIFAVVVPTVLDRTRFTRSYALLVAVSWVLTATHFRIANVTAGSRINILQSYLLGGALLLLLMLYKLRAATRTPPITEGATT